MTADTLVINGRVVDGTGAPSRLGDVAIRNGRIVPPPPRAEAAEIIDASGKVVAPGFIDIHSHGDLVLAWPDDGRRSLLEGRLAQGITTEIVGNCGLGAAPLFGHASGLLPAINGWMSPASFDWGWRDLDGYFEHLEALGLPVNVGSLVAHGPLRLGAAHLAPGDAPNEARREMERRLDESLEQGAFGLSAGLIYPPGMYTSTAELLALAKRLVGRDGLFTCHIRGSSETLLDAVAELVGIGRDSGARVHHSHAEAVGRPHWTKLRHLLAMEDEARRDGVRLSADMFPYTVAATMMLAIYPPWSLEGGLSKLVERLQDSETRETIRRDIETVTPSWPPWTEGGWPHNLVKAVGWDRILVSTVGSEKNRELEGMSLVSLGEARGSHPFDAISDLMIEEEGRVGQFVLDITGDDGLATLVENPDIAFITDANDYGKGKPHPAAYGSFPRVLGRYVRGERRLSLEEAVRRMTSLPADTIGIRNRGRLVEGAHADIVIFDPNEVKDLATLDAPRQKARGIERVLVNGSSVYAEGKPTGELPGTTLRRGGE
ncbi:MAG TPA: D-aminoacylase [Vicinamibacteria bacterium]|nr:D-aminoacylase [Vicinamibacteria bacterium]